MSAEQLFATMKKTHGGVISVAHHHKNYSSRRKEKTEREASPSGSRLLPRQYGKPGTGNQPGPSGPILYTADRKHSGMGKRRCFAEKASGLSIKRRKEFQRLLDSCRNGEIDMVLVKSVSRFGRDSLEMFKILREFQDLDVDVFFEEEGVHSRDRYLRYYLTVYCAFAQAQSENASRNIRWGIEHSFKDGTSGYAEFVCFGYKRDKDGELCPDEPNASIVRRMFEMRAAGASLGAISDWLYQQGVPSPRGKERWSRETIKKLLQNEKYIGSVILQKTYVQDLFSRKQCKNMGEKLRYLYQFAHPAIISPELFEKVNPAIYAIINRNPEEADAPGEKEEGKQP